MEQVVEYDPICVLKIYMYVCIYVAIFYLFINHLSIIYLAIYLLLYIYVSTYLSTYLPFVYLGEWVESPNYYHCLPLRVRMEYTDSKVQGRTPTFYLAHFWTVKILIGCFVIKK